MQVKSVRSMEDGAILMRVDDVMADYAPDALLRELARAFADRYLADHYQELVALIEPKAIATLAVAEAAAKIRETLEKKIPDKVLEVVRKETWQRGIFGGMTRIR